MQPLTTLTNRTKGPVTQRPARAATTLAPKTHRTLLAVLLAALSGGLLPVAVATPAHAATTRTYSAPGKYTLTVPAGVTRIAVTLTGAGGGGGGGGDGPPTFFPPGYGGAGGGGGATVSCTRTVKPGVTLTVEVGAGGAGGAGIPWFQDSSPRGAGFGGFARIRIGGTNLALWASGGEPGNPATRSPGGAGGTNMGCAGGHRVGGFEGGAGGRGFNHNEPGAGGEPGYTVHASCPAGTGRGGDGGFGGAAGGYDGQPGHSACVVLTY